jgi:hypothetical protein
VKWKFATVALLLLVLFGAGLLIKAGIKQRQADEIIDKYAVAELERQKYVPGTFETPDIPEAPAGTKPILHAAGSVRYAPVSAVPQGVSAPSPAEPGVLRVPPAGAVEAPPTPCNLDDLDVTLRCVVDGLATPTKPWVKMMTSGTISGWGQTRDLPPIEAGDIKMQMAPSVVPPRWHLDLLGGVAAGSRFGLEAGAAWSGKSRLGPYALVEWQPATGGSSSESYVSTGQPSTVRVHAGIRLRIR